MLALASGSHPRCGVKSPVRLLSGLVSCLLLRKMWDDWVIGTERRFIVSTKKMATDIKFLASRLNKKDMFHPITIYFGVSAVTLGVTREPKVVLIDVTDQALAGWSKSVYVEDDCHTVILRDSAGPVPTTVRLSTKQWVRGVRHLTASSEWAVFGGASAKTKERCVAFVGISPYRPITGTVQPNGVIFTIPTGWSVFRTDCLLGELVVTLVKAPADLAELALYLIMVVPTKGVTKEKMLAMASKTCVSLPASRNRVESIVRMRKQSGEHIFIVSTHSFDNQAWTRSAGSTFELPEGNTVEFSNVKWLNTTGTDLSQLSESLFCVSSCPFLPSKPNSPPPASCEIWDCNDTTRPIKLIQLLVLVPSPSTTATTTTTALPHGGVRNEGDAQTPPDNGHKVIDAETGCTVFTQLLLRY
ncbi:hypothetical protein Pelo_19123 [Pelomyxa schiedti]|nr:hypothetical protein Pelo_19123 [Pelomyxa schiedti]